MPPQRRCSGNRRRFLTFAKFGVSMSAHYLLKLSCPNQPGIVARVTAELFSQSGNILEAHQFDDTETGGFFTRIVFNLGDERNIGKLVGNFQSIG
jgi:formyltetrahydrofolate deformylase